MRSVLRRTREAESLTLPPLYNGDRLTQPEFHRRYEAYPEDAKFELIGGIVFVASPLRVKHSRYDDEVSFLFGYYRRVTRGVEAIHGASTILGQKSEPQPDVGLLILEEYGGQTHVDEGDYIQGAPELITEIAYSTVSLDMRLKKEDYQRAGVCEYLVVCVEEEELHWFDFRSGGAIPPDEHGIYRSRAFPGLWLDGPALLARKSSQLLNILKRGIRSREHAAFVKRSQAAHRKHKPA